MEIIGNLTENEVVATFLKAELASPRWRKKILGLLEEDGKNINILNQPDLKDERDNKYRRNLLKKFRGWGLNNQLFTNFPDKVNWKRVTIKREELEKVKYIDYSYWNKLSKGSRLAKVGAKTVKEGVEVFNISNKPFMDTVKKLKNGTKLPKMIFVSESDNADLIILEGHVRATAYLLLPGSIPSELEVIVGFSEAIRKWDLY